MTDLNKAVASIQISGIRKFADLVTQYNDVLSLTIGQPHFPTPKHIKDAAIQAITEGHTSYTSNRGLPSLRQAVSAYYGAKSGVVYDAQTEILVTVGATHALDISLRALLAPGDEVVIPAPAYPGYEPLVRLAQGTVRYVDTATTRFKLTPAQLQTAITPRTKVVVLASPVNPTGVAYTKDELSALAAILAKTDVYVISDEIYSELQFDEQHTSFATFAALRERTVVIQGLSKSHSMTGWRIGFTLAPKKLTDEMVKVLQYSVSCASSISQHAALEALVGGGDDSAIMRAQYAQNRDMVVEALDQMNLPLVKPAGAFYAFPDIRPLQMTSQTFAMRLLDEARVAVVPGDAFSEYGEGFVRLSYACEPVLLQAGLQRLDDFVKKCHSSM
ncbi:aminotransferase class I/II-fold pyridoxal phosphate-dependent enzyme [Alicyclobacillus fodiniaquatilis]|uniref:Aminotransferase n=1 Tax=Alicyclobacillus fodiniaquatilis TaxID=1661150 RepID=A0ABW4JHZ5_9BACL